MKLIVGLGNPGVKYETTRHNAGFLILDYYANKNGIEIKKIKNKALVGEAIINGEKVIFIKPQTFMNLSGDSVLSVAEYYGIDNEDIYEGVISTLHDSTASISDIKKLMSVDYKVRIPYWKIPEGRKSMTESTSHVIHTIIGDDLD